MKKKRENQSNPEELNSNILNIITPAGIDITNTYANVSENIGKIFCISKYPANVDYGWLANLCNLEGTSTSIEYRHTSSERMQMVMNKKISELKSNYETVKGESEKQKISQAIKDLQEMINRISVREEPVGYVNTMIHVQATSHSDLNSRIKRVSSAVSLEECNLKILKFRQGQALKAMSPYGIPDTENVSNMGERNMPMGTFVGGFPMANAGLNDSEGYIIGKTKNNRIVRLNQWARGRDRTNSNWIVTGVPGSGKSTALKLIFSSEYALGTKIILFDPEKEYVDLTMHPFINGEVIDCSGGITGRINPLQIRAVPKITEADLESDERLEDFLTYDTSHGSSDMALYLQQLRLFFRLYLGEKEYTSEIKTILEQCLIELYNEFGITWDTDISKLHNTDFPIISDLYQLIKKKTVSGTDAYSIDIYQKLLVLLYSSAEGADKFIWNGHTTLNPKTTFIDLDVSNLLELDDNVKRAQFYNITMWAWQQMAENRQEKVLFGLDEGYLFVDPDSPDLMKFIRNVSKRARKYESGLMFITHSCADILDPSVKRYGQAIIDNACYKFIMGTDGKNLEETKVLFNLTERESTILAGKNRGQGIFMCGGIRLDLRIEVPDEFLEMFGSAGGR